MKMIQFIKKTRFAVVYPFIALMLIYAQTSERAMLWGILLALIGEGIRLWANGYVGHAKVNRTRKHQREARIGSLITAGPYAHVRHPLYLGTLLIALGVSVACGRMPLLVLVAGVFVVIYQQKISQEEELLLEEIGQDYVDYKESVPRWFPSSRGYKKKGGAWSWEGIRASKEWKTLLWIGVLFILLYLREEFYQEHEFFTEPYEWPKHILFICVMLMLVASDLLIARKRKRARPAHKETQPLNILSRSDARGQSQ